MLGEILKQLRIKKGLTQEQAAKIFGIGRGGYAHWEINTRQPNYDKLKKISQYYGVTTDYLLKNKCHTGSNSMTMLSQRLNKMASALQKNGKISSAEYDYSDIYLAAEIVKGKC